MKNQFLRKGIIWASSILIVGGIASGFLFAKDRIEQKTVESQYEPPKAVMSQEEIEALYAAHKEDNFLAEEIETSVSGLESDSSVEKIQESVVEEILQSQVTQEILETQTVQTIENNIEYGAVSSEVRYPYNCPVDFAGLWKVNQDVYAWITIPGTVIDYPILQHTTDNTYYLNYNIDGSYGYPGCIYTENLNAKDFTDNNTVIYGHNMKNGTMFAGLHKFEDASFFEKHKEIIIYTPEKKLNYTIFAAYVYDDRHLLYSFNFADKAVYTNYLNEIQNMRSMNANIRKDVTVTNQNKIITLVTCIGKRPNNRLLVQAVLLEDGE